MRKLLMCATGLALVVLASGIVAWAQDTVKWSAPMDHYPNQWYPTAAPPQNPYGYGYPYAGYGYGHYGGYGGQGAYGGYGGQGAYGGYYQGQYPGHYPGYPHAGYPGNPYYYQQGR